MPDPKKYKTKDKWMAACVPAVTGEGKPQKQAVAQCLNMWRNRKSSARERLV